MGSKIKYTLEHVRELLSQNVEYEIVSIEEGNKQITFKCGCGNEFSYKYYYALNNLERIKCNECINVEKITKWYCKTKEFIESSDGNGCGLLSNLDVIRTEIKTLNETYKYKISIKCRCGESFKTTFDKFKSQSKRQCNECGNKILIDKRKHKLDDVKKYIENNSLSKLLSNEYINMKENLKLLCSCGDIFYTSFDSFKNHEKNKCNECSKEILRKMFFKGKSEFVKEVYSLVKDEYVVLGDYVNTNTNIKMYHSLCGKSYDVRPSKFILGNRCTYCNESKGEQRIRKFLESNNIKFISEYKFNGLFGLGGNHLRFDFAIFKEEKLMLLVEYDGEQHYKWINHFMSYKDFEKLQEHDRIKDSYCVANNIRLVRISYLDFNDIENILIKNIPELLNCTDKTEASYN